jgi:hypothetical protein
MFITISWFDLGFTFRRGLSHDEIGILEQFDASGEKADSTTKGNPLTAREKLVDGKRR